jgi:hypothetical protein
LTWQLQRLGFLDYSKCHSVLLPTVLQVLLTGGFPLGCLQSLLFLLLHEAPSSPQKRILREVILAGFSFGEFGFGVERYRLFGARESILLTFDFLLLLEVEIFGDGFIFERSTFESFEFKLRARLNFLIWEIVFGEHEVCLTCRNDSEVWGVHIGDMKN